MLNRICLILALLLIPVTGWSANIYVDITLGANITNGTYSIASRDDLGTDGNAYTTVQAAVTAMSGGDDLYLRGGTYQNLELTGSEASGMGHVRVVQSKSGTAENWTSIQSYPGEWAILDGEDNCDYSLPHAFGSVLGMPAADDSGYWDVSYLLIERLEILNGASPDGEHACGLFFNGGPIIVRYCYIHDCIANTGGNNPGAIEGYVWHDSTVEYCKFENNGTDVSLYEQHAVVGTQLFSDYEYSTDYWEDSPQDIDGALRNNEIRYNLHDNTDHHAYCGMHGKGRQYLANKTIVTWDYKEYGDKIHHNIFLDCLTAVACQQDFAQIYNNIMETPTSTSNRTGITFPDVGMNGNNMAVTVYNNTIIKGRINNNFGFSDDNDYVINPYVYIYNNLMDQAPADSDWSAVINQGQPYMMNPFIYSSSRTKVSHNYLYRGTSNNFKVTKNTGDEYGIISSATYDSTYSDTNYVKTSSEGSDNIYEGVADGDQYTSRGAHVVTGAVTIANGGKGGYHPYLSGVTIPAYIGATNPNDDDWVAGVYGFGTAYFTLAVGGTDPTWVEGMVADTAAPTIISIAVNGLSWAITGNETLNIGTGGSGDWVATMSVSGTVTLTYSAGDGTTALTFTGDKTVAYGETGTIDYMQPTDGWEDNAGNDLATIDDDVVINSVAQPAGSSGGILTIGAGNDVITVGSGSNILTVE